VTLAHEALLDLLQATRRSALRLEMRDTYAGTDPDFAAWQRGQPFDSLAEDAKWHAVIGPPIHRGADVRRARVVSEPVTDYIRWEYGITASASIAIGERVRWLPRKQASNLALPGNDFWLIDSQVIFLHFSGDGAVTNRELAAEPSVVKFCNAAFEAVWERGVDHADYRPT